MKGHAPDLSLVRSLSVPYLANQQTVIMKEASIGVYLALYLALMMDVMMEIPFGWLMVNPSDMQL